MAPCNLSHCYGARYYCHLYSCKIELRTRLDRRCQTRDDLKKRLKTEKAKITLLKQQIDQACGATAQYNSFMRKAQQTYDDEMSETLRKNSYRCTECAISGKDNEIALLRRKIKAAEAFQDFLRQYPGTPSPHGKTYADQQQPPHLVSAIFSLDTVGIARFIAAGFKVERIPSQ